MIAFQNDQLSTLCPLFFSVTMFTAFLSPTPGLANDCRAKLSKEAFEEIKRLIPNARLLPSSEQDPYTGARDGPKDGCTNVTSADYNGDGLDDWAVLLKEETSKKNVLVAVINNGKSFKVTKLPISQDISYLLTVDAGRYDRSEALESAVGDSLEKTHIVCKSKCFLAGVSQSSEFIYAWANGKWSYVQISD